METAQTDRRETARNLFLHTDKNRQEIADILDINSKTLYLWIKNGKWEEMKTAARQSPMIMVQDMFNHIQAINENIYRREDRCPTPKEVDMLKKLAVTAKNLEAKYLGIYIEVFQELISFIKSDDLELAKSVTRIADKYIKGKVEKQKYSPMPYVNAVKENLRNQAKEETEEEKITEQENNTVSAHSTNLQHDDEVGSHLTEHQRNRASSGIVPEDEKSMNATTVNHFSNKPPLTMPDKNNAQYRVTQENSYPDTVRRYGS